VEHAVGAFRHRLDEGRWIFKGAFGEPGGQPPEIGEVRAGAVQRDDGPAESRELLDEVEP
jgi:hypothetical protein